MYAKTTNIDKVVELLYFLCKYCIVISGALVGSSLDVLLFLLAILLSEPHEKPRRNNDRVKKNIHFFWLHAILSISFLLLSPSTPLLFLSDVLAEWPLNRRIVRSGILWFCVMISWANGWICKNLLQFNTSWLVLRTWYYYRLCFSFSYSGCPYIN